MPEDNNILIFPDSRPTRADAVKNRELILRTASRLFEAQGVDAVSMTQLAQEAGIGKGTLYRHFNNKTDLCHALLDHDMRELQNATLQRLNRRDDAVATLRWFLGAIVRFVDRNHEMLLVAEPGVTSALEIPAHLWWRQTIRGLLEQSYIEGDLDYITDVFYVLLDVNTINFQRRGRSYSLDRIIDGLMDTLDRYI